MRRRAWTPSQPRVYAVDFDQLSRDGSAEISVWERTAKIAVGGHCSFTQRLNFFWRFRQSQFSCSPLASIAAAGGLHNGRAIHESTCGTNFIRNSSAMPRACCPHECAVAQRTTHGNLDTRLKRAKVPGRQRGKRFWPQVKRTIDFEPEWPVFSFPYRW